MVPNFMDVKLVSHPHGSTCMLKDKQRVQGTTLGDFRFSRVRVVFQAFGESGTV